jgi:hypothetical protein
MINDKDESTKKAKPEGNTDPSVPSSPDVKKDGWSAEEIAEQAAHKDGTEIKQEIKQGEKTQKVG